MMNKFLFLVIGLIHCMFVQAGGVVYFQNPNDPGTAIEECTINWLLMTDQGIDQVDLTCDSQPVNSIIIPGAARRVTINGVILECFMLDLLMQDNDNFVSRLNCFDEDDLIFDDGFENVSFGIIYDVSK